MAARFVRDEEAAGSNPATPTTKLHVAARFRKSVGCLGLVQASGLGANASRSYGSHIADQQ